jgi:hypothetical protein
MVHYIFVDIIQVCNTRALTSSIVIQPVQLL